MAEVCRDMSLESEEEVSEFGIFTFLEDRKFNYLYMLMKINIYLIVFTCKIGKD